MRSREQFAVSRVEFTFPRAFLRKHVISPTLIASRRNPTFTDLPTWCIMAIKPLKAYLCLFAQQHPEFKLPELLSLASLTKTEVKFDEKSYSKTVSLSCSAIADVL